MSFDATRRTGFLAYDGMQALDLFGPLEAFQETNEILDCPVPLYENLVVTQDGGPVTSSSGVVISAHASLRDCPPLHTLVIPGGEGARKPDFPQAVLDWIVATEPATQRIGSVCTGLFILARTGLIDSMKATTHWHHAKEAQQAFPGLRVSPDALYIREGKFFTAAGVTAGIDMTLALIEEDAGTHAASRVARHLVVYLKRPGGQHQYSSALRDQEASAPDFSDLTVWMEDHLDNDLSAGVLADRACLSERQFRRKFTRIMGETPARYVERLRIERASRMLLDSKLPVGKIASAVGFYHTDSFIRAFRRRRELTPSAYRKRFAGASQ